MEILFGNVALYGTERGGKPSAITLVCRYAAQVEEFFRASQVQVFDRGNAQTTVSFGSVRQHATVSIAENFLLEHETALTGRANVTFKAPNGSMRYLLNAKITDYRAECLGVSTRHQYTIVGGLLTKEKPV
jgi:hypothetical protein